MKFEEKIIRLSIYLESHEQCKEYKSLLLQKLKENYEKKAFEKYGIINSIISMDKIYYEEMMKTTPTIYFLIDTKVETYFPKKEDKIELEITKILNYGIFLECSSFRVLIPSVPSSYELKKDDELYYKNKDKIIKIGSKIEFIITDVRFEKAGFHCLAKIVE